MLVEDELFKIRNKVVKGSSLCTTDASIFEIANLAGATEQPQPTLSRDAVEQAFSRLTAIVQGRPAALDSIPVSPQFCATLMILREFMHHLDFASISVKP